MFKTSSIYYFKVIIWILRQNCLKLNICGSIKSTVDSYLNFNNKSEICFHSAHESESRSAVSDSFRPNGLHSPWNSPGQNTGVGSRSLLQGIFPTQGSNPGLLHCRRILYRLSHQGSPTLEWVDYPSSSGSSRSRNRTGVSCIAGGFFTSWATRGAPKECCAGTRTWTLDPQFKRMLYWLSYLHIPMQKTAVMPFEKSTHVPESKYRSPD